MDETPERKIALFGGTFDPPHAGHLFLAEQAQQACSLDRIVFIPCWRSPHKVKAAGADGESRAQMLELLASGKPWAEVSRFEISQAEPSFSWKTAEYFCSTLPPGHALHWILGQDQWEALDSWSRPERLAELLTFIVFARDGQVPEPRTGFRSIAISGTHPDSSTQIRGAILGGADPLTLLPGKVGEFVAANRLYLD